LVTVTIHEGRNRQVRRMCAAAGLHVTRLRRIAEGSLTLGDLPKGKWRYLTDGEIRALKK
jgi:23S rRNA pseudouridine2605 synthase